MIPTSPPPPIPIAHSYCGVPQLGHLRLPQGYFSVYMVASKAVPKLSSSTEICSLLIALLLLASLVYVKSHSWGDQMRISSLILILNSKFMIAKNWGRFENANLHRAKTSTNIQVFRLNIFEYWF